MDIQTLRDIRERRSVRCFLDEDVDDHTLGLILEAGRWAPSGLNNQPWRFALVRSPEKKAELADLTHYSHVLNGAAVCVVVFLDQEACYDPLKDAQAAGACLQNMLLAAHALGLGAVWLGEILKNEEKVRECLGVPAGMELQAVMALGRPESGGQRSDRRPLEELILVRC